MMARSFSALFVLSGSLALGCGHAPLGGAVPVQHRPTVLDATLSSGADAISAERYRLDTPGSEIDVGGAVIQIRGPIERVLEVVQDYESYRHILPRIEQSRIIGRRSGRHTDVYLKAPILGGVANVWGVARFAAPKPHGEDGGTEIAGRMIRGNLEAWWGSWKLASCGERCTELRLEMFIDLAIPLPPDAVTGEVEWACDKAVTAVRDIVERGGSSVASD